MKTTRIIEEAKSFGFQTIDSMNEHDIAPFIEKHSEFIQKNPQGYGLWIWKPKIILEKLTSLCEGDILLYCDAGMHLNAGGLKRYYEYLEMLNKNPIITFAMNDVYKAQHYVKNDAIVSYYPEFAIRLDRYHYAGVMLIKKCPETMNLITDWLSLCEVHHFIDRSKSTSGEAPWSLGNDCDNGLFNLCLVKHGISQSVYPDETNIYTPNGYQHCSAPESCWKSLDMFPFQVRRLRP